MTVERDAELAARKGLTLRVSLKEGLEEPDARCPQLNGDRA
jgi:hypothetical protein